MFYPESQSINQFPGDRLNITSRIHNDHILGCFYEAVMLPHILSNSISLNIYYT